MIILGTNSIKDTGYDVANSCRFDDGSSAYLHKTPSGAGTSADLFTFSMWIKRGIISSSDRIVLFYAQSDAQNFDRISFTDADVLEWKGVRSDSQAFNLTTSQVFRDISSWYHLHFIWDSADSTADNRMRIYVNGTQVTAFGTRANPSSGLDAIIGSAQKHSVGSTGSSGTYYDGYMAEVVYLDGQELTPDGNTGEFDEDSGIWKPIDVSGLTFGTNGFYLDFENSGALGADVSGNSNNFTVNNLTAIDQSTDSCTNNSATWNSTTLLGGAVAVYSEGNLKSAIPTGGAGKSLTNIGVSSGKWYTEVKQTSVSNPLGNGEQLMGVVSDTFTYNTTALDNTINYSYMIRNYNGAKSENGSGSSNWHGNWTAGDIIGVALDMDNNRVTFSKNGQYANGSGSWNQSSPTAYISLSTIPTYYFVCVGSQHSTASATAELNSGSPSFAISSGNQDADGFGNFEYAVPSGYFSLNTKNLAEYG